MTRVKDKKVAQNSAPASQEVPKKAAPAAKQTPAVTDINLPQKRKLPAAAAKQTEATKRQKTDIIASKEATTNACKKVIISPNKTSSPQKATACPS